MAEELAERELVVMAVPVIAMVLIVAIVAALIQMALTLPPKTEPKVARQTNKTKPRLDMPLEHAIIISNAGYA